MSYLFSSLQQLVNDASTSLSQSARRLVSTSSRDSTASTQSNSDYPSGGGGITNDDESSSSFGSSRLHLPLSARSSLNAASEVFSGDRRSSRGNLTVPRSSLGAAGASPVGSPGKALEMKYKCRLFVI